jgi:hypothetical protein
MDISLFRAGKFDTNFVLDKCNRVQLKTMYQIFYSKEIDPELVEKFPENKYIVSDVVSHLFTNMNNKEIDQKKLLSKFIDQNDNNDEKIENTTT